MRLLLLLCCFPLFVNAQQSNLKFDIDMEQTMDQIYLGTWEDVDSNLQTNQLKYCAIISPECANIFYLQNELAYAKFEYQNILDTLPQWLSELPKTVDYEYVKAKSKMLLAKVNLETNDLDKVNEYASQVLEMAEHSVGLRGVAIQYLGAYHFLKGDKLKAVELLKEAIDILEIAAPMSVDLGGALNDLGVVSRATQRGDLFVFYLKKAEQIYESKLGAKHPRKQEFYQNLGTAYKDQGDSENAVLYLQKVIDYYDLNGISPDRKYINTSIFLATEYLDLKDYEASRERFEWLINRFGNAPQVPATFKAKIFSFYLLALGKSNERGQGKVIAQKLESILPELPAVAQHAAYFGLATYYLKEEKQTTAKKIIDQYKSSIDTMQTHNGEYYRLLANYELQNKAYRRAISAIQSKIAILIPDFEVKDIYQNPTATQLQSLNEVYMRLGEKAELLFQLYEVEKDQKALSAGYEIAQLVDRRMTELIGFQGYAMGANKWGRLLDKLPVLSQIAIVHGQQNKDDAAIELAFRLTENSRNFAFKANIQEQNLARLGFLPDSLILQRMELRTLLAQLKKEKETGYSARKSNLSRISGTQVKLTNLQAKIKANYPSFYDLEQATNQTNLAQLSASLDAQSLFIEYICLAEKCLTFVVSKEGVEIIEVPLNATFRQDLKRFENMISNVQIDATTFTKTAHRLYQTLLQVILDKYPDVNHLIIVPDETLENLSFEILTKKPIGGDFRDLPYLCQTHSISYAYNADMLLRKPEYTTKKPFAAFAPSYDNKSTNQTAWMDGLARAGSLALPFAQKEATQIATLTKGEVYSGAAASVAYFRAKANDYQILHFAMHTYLDEQNPFQSYFVFDQQAPSAAQLSVADLYQLNMGAEMAVLSACNTEIGQTPDAQVSLANAFAYAGLPSVVASSWSVPDKQSAGLMVDFYKGIAAQQSRHAALTQAKLNYLQSAKSSNAAHPFYWAGFTLTGQYGTIEPLSDDSIWKWLLLGLLSLGGGVWLFSKKGKQT